MRKLIQHVILSLAVITSGHAAQTVTKPPTMKEWMNLKSVVAPRISPDGRFVAYQLQEPNWDENRLEAELWIASVSSDQSYQLTNARGSSTNARWSPDGKQLAFLSNRDGRQQIYLAAPPSLEALQLTQTDSGINTFEWSADGRRMAFTSTESLPASEVTETDEFRIMGAPPTTAASLWLIDVPLKGAANKPQPERLTRGADFNVGSFSFSPDSQRIAFDATKDTSTSSFMTSDVFVINLADKSVRKIVDSPGFDGTPVWSPDGGRVAYYTTSRAKGAEVFYYTNGLIAVVPAEGGEPRVLTEAFDESPLPVAWSQDGIYFNALERSYQHLYRIDPQTKAIARMSEPYTSVFSMFSFSKDFKQAAFLCADAQSFPEICVSSLEKRFAPRKLTSMQEQFRRWPVATREVVNWKSKDGTPIEGVLAKPKDFDASKKYPLLVTIHTGPSLVDQATIDRDWPYPTELYAERGALVLKVNYRGSTGYGQRFRALLVGNLGLPEYEDIITGVDYLISKGIVDEKRVGAMGYSHGGYIAAFISAYSDRFRAVSAGALVSDWTTYYTNSDSPLWAVQFHRATPWDNPEIYRKTAPLSYIKNARTPTLIQHGELDRRAPIAGAYELYRALQDRNVPVRMIVYKGAGHVPGGLKQLYALMLHNYEWFEQWIWEDKAEGRVPQ